MRRPLLLLVLLAPLLVSSPEASAAPADALQLLTGFAAKETCSCVFVVEQSDAYCAAFGQQAGYAVQIQIDHAKKTVTASFGATRTARMGAWGCTLDPLP